MDLTRKQLYKLVWENPLKFIFETYGGTYQDLKDLLLKYDIPSPENGYWSRLRAGHSIKIPILPVRVNNTTEKVIYEPKEVKKRIKPNLIVPTIAATRNYQQQDQLVLEAKRVFHSLSKGREEGKLMSIGYQALDINVSPKMMDRALAFFNIFITALKGIGGTIVVKPHQSTVICSNEKLKVSLREKQNRMEKGGPTCSWDAHEYVPSGILCFKLGEHSWDSKEWKDTAYTVLEDKFDDILEYIQIKVINIQQERRENERRRFEREKEHQRQLEVEKLQTTEINNFIALKTNAELWEKATMMRKYLQDMEDIVKINGTYDVKMQNYLEWARKKVDWYDPLVDSRDELFDKVDKTTLTLAKKLGW